MSSTLRENIQSIINLIKPDMFAVEASEKMVELSRLLGNLGEHIVKFERDYLQVKIDIMTTNDKMSMNKIELMAQNSEQYTILQQSRVLEKTTLEVIRSLKYRCRALEDEKQVSNNL